VVIFDGERRHDAFEALAVGFEEEAFFHGGQGDEWDDVLLQSGGRGTVGHKPVAAGKMGDWKVASPWEVRRHVAPPRVDLALGRGGGNS
jgi:hypothetical protein